MQGTYRDDQRPWIRDIWRREQIPHFLEFEIAPIAGFLEEKSSITAIDVGANKGFWTKALLDRFPGRIDRVYMIDASPENYFELTNKSDNLLFDDLDFDFLSSYHLAISNMPGFVTLYTEDEGSPLGSLFPHTFNGQHMMGEAGALVHELRVPCETIDNIVASQKIGHIDVMKIDIEGNELYALLGAEKTIASGNIDTVLFEFGCHQVESRHFFRDFWDFFTRYGYKLYSTPGGKLSHIPEYGYGLENFTLCWNFVASRL